MGLSVDYNTRPGSSFASLVIGDAFQEQHKIPPEGSMTEAETLTLADFGFADAEEVEDAKHSMPLGAFEAAHGVIEGLENTSGDENAAISMEVDTDDSTRRADIATGSETVQAPTGYAAFFRANPEMKRSGRPKGWKKSIHMKAKSVQGDPSNTAASKRKSVKGQKPAKGEEASRAASPPIPVKTEASSEQGKGYAAFRKVNPHIEKKVGRPVGWRKAIHGKRATANTDEAEPEEETQVNVPVRGIEDEDLPLSFWEGVLEAAGIAISIEKNDESGRRDSVLNLQSRNYVASEPSRGKEDNGGLSVALGLPSSL
ncbi:Hypothetical predicted protein [Lecanosticta acicola]|uniref:Uncharacterized protein n=1 Tax=Lecanosticta acicola TaxID=111012 RepID=A0AAI9EEG0_9PEZI|nr:Hypothetical predicted protein [Lecanosticta acicola]